jgi:tRNA modification GTPase
MTAEAIYAPCSGLGQSAITVIRLSGGETSLVLSALLQGALPPSRQACLRRLCDPATGEEIDHGLVIWFPAPGSFTGEDMAELHLHGGRAVLARILDVLSSRPHTRLAEPGEFTRRAFENGKLDLTAAEGIADLVAAETEAQRVQALGQMEGVLGKHYESWRERLVSALAHMEAGIDFSDEDLSSDPMVGKLNDILWVHGEITQHLDDNRRGERLRDGICVAILGPPNVGKSSLLNALAQKDAAIVAATAGTTRDVIEVHLDLGGYPVTLVDTAGLRATNDEVESEGARRAAEKARQADLKLVVMSPDVALEHCKEALRFCEGETLLLLNKADLLPDFPEFETQWEARDAPFLEEQDQTRERFAISVKTGAGLSQLLGCLENRIGSWFSQLSAETPSLTRQRHRDALRECHAALTRVLAALGVEAVEENNILAAGDSYGRGAASPVEENTVAAELVAEDLRLAVRCLGRITGSVDVEDLLDVIFSDFCIGK